MSDFSLKGFDGFTDKPVNISVRKVNGGVTPEEIKKAIKDDNIDEVVVKDKGNTYIVSADELKYTDGIYKDGDLSYSPISNAAKANPNLSFIDDEINENKISRAGIASLIGGGLIKTKEDMDKIFKEDTSKINKISEPVSEPAKNKILKGIK